MRNKNALELKVQGQAVCNCSQSVGLKLPQFQCHTSAAWAIVHVAMSFNELIEGEHFYVQRQQHPVGGQLVDFAQGALDGLYVLVNAQLRLASEVTDTVHKKLNILLKTGTGWQTRLVAALQTVEHQAAARRQHITQH